MSTKPNVAATFEPDTGLQSESLPPKELFIIGFTYFRGNWNQGGVEIGQDIEKAAKYLMAAYGPRIQDPENTPFEPFHDHIERMLRSIYDIANARINTSFLQRGLMSEFEESVREANVEQALTETELVHGISRFILTLPRRNAGAVLSDLALKSMQPPA